MITLNINYDPSVPDFMQNDPQQEWIEKVYPASKPPILPFRNGYLVNNRFLIVERGTVKTGGFDPYAGEVWTVSIFPPSRNYRFCSHAWLRLELSNLFCWTFKTRFRGGKTLQRRSGYELKDMPRWFRAVWNFMEYRYDWWKYNVDSGDAYDYLSYYE